MSSFKVHPLALLMERQRSILQKTDACYFFALYSPLCVSLINSTTGTSLGQRDTSTFERFSSVGKLPGNQWPFSWNML